MGLYLIHHGVKGQEWGVRNGPPYPIDHKIMKKGTRLNSVSGDYKVGTNYLNSGRPLYTYNPDDEWDSKVYKGPFSYYLVRDRGKQFIKEHKFEVIKDLKMPTRKEREREFKDLYADKKFKKDLIDTLKNIQGQLVKYNVASTPEMKEKIKNLDVKRLKTDEDYEVAYEIFGHAMEAQHAYKSTHEYMERMSKKYDAMVDDNNQGIYNNTHDPVIIFRANESLKALNDMAVDNEGYLADTINGKEIMDNYNYVKNELAKEGKNVKL